MSGGCGVRLAGECRTGKVDRHSSHAHLPSPGIVRALFNAAKADVFTPNYHAVVSIGNDVSNDLLRIVTSIAHIIHFSYQTSFI